MCWHLPIFPGRHQPSIFGTTELNFCVRYGNRWTLSVINTNLFFKNSCYYTTYFYICQHFFKFFYFYNQRADTKSALLILTDFMHEAPLRPCQPYIQQEQPFERGGGFLPLQKSRLRVLQIHRRLFPHRDERAGSAEPCSPYL